MVVTKKAISGRFWLVMAVMLCAAVFLGCGWVPVNAVKHTTIGETQPIPEPEEDTTPGRFEGLSAKTEKRILEDYNNLGRFPDLRSYYGTYNGYFVLKFGDYRKWENPEVGPHSVGDILFAIHREDDAIITWKEGQFNRLAKVYEEGLLQREDIESIRDIHKTELPELYHENMKPWKGNFEELDPETERLINLELIERQISIGSVVWIPESQYFNFYGKYNDCVVIGATKAWPGSGMLGINLSARIADIDFTFISNCFLYAWKQDTSGTGCLIPAYQAYDLGYFTYDDVYDIYEEHRKYFPFNPILEK